MAGLVVVGPAVVGAAGDGRTTATGAGTPVEAHARAAACRPGPGLLADRPRDAYRLPGGASVRVWAAGPRKRPPRVRLAVVTVPPGALVPRVAASPTIARAVPLKTMLHGDRRSVVALNGGHFFAGVPGIPTKSQISNGVLRKGIRVVQTNVAVYADARVVALARAKLAGTLRTAHGSLPVATLNWQGLPRHGVAVYTHAWGGRPHPAGPRTLVVAGDEVRAVLGRHRGVRRPPPAHAFVTAAPGPYARALRRLDVGDAVDVSVSPTGRRVSDARPRPPLGRPTGLLGVGTTLLERGVNQAVCTRRNELRRPRSVLGWRPDGTMLVAAASGRGKGRFRSSGGLTVHQTAEVLRRLGAVRAVNFDGGSSTTLLVRREVGGPLVRLDRPWSPIRPRVTDGLAFRLPPR